MKLLDGGIVGILVGHIEGTCERGKKLLRKSVRMVLQKWQERKRFLVKKKIVLEQHFR
jgi:hypothetical protein